MSRVLIIDDSAFLRGFMRTAFEGAGDVVDDFEPLSSLEVLERLQAFAPDIVITDFAMPMVDGFAVVKMVRRFGPRLPIILFTSTRDARREEKLLAAGNLRILHKPAPPETMMIAVREMLAG